MGEIAWVDVFFQITSFVMIAAPVAVCIAVVIKRKKYT
ncbi:hypothetical protein N781_09045 [Pontibacillus halophilus JSM 076056 = DSM 19796]|uniref:Uncharacterized protein n=1 Tax=Pontibacillus halophilus JSM 076056 = DSM 19796 TaxID=1385510 RepID=A0A0A5GCT5_9BACI|nr:hypothetical protein N781_09045 [Pontibacillus halophilus JSM 076056 = DSM 19796]